MRFTNPLTVGKLSSGARGVATSGYRTLLPAIGALLLLAPVPINGMTSDEPHLVHRDYTVAPDAPKSQTVAEADKKSEGCMSCHSATDRHTMHANPGVTIGCADC